MRKSIKQTGEQNISILMETILENLIIILDYRVKSHGHLVGYTQQGLTESEGVKRLKVHASMWCLVFRPMSMTDLPA